MSVAQRIYPDSAVSSRPSEW